VESLAKLKKDNDFSRTLGVKKAVTLSMCKLSYSPFSFLALLGVND